MMTAKELIVKARNAEEEANKKEALMAKSVEKLKQAEEKRQEKGFEMKKIEREFEVNILSRLFRSAFRIWNEIVSYRRGSWRKGACLSTWPT